MSNSSAQVHDGISESRLHHIPIDIVQYNLLFFLNRKSAVNLTRTSRLLFRTLRLKIHRTQLISVDRFIQQSNSAFKHVGVSSAVMVISKRELQILSKYYTDDNDIKVPTCPLLRLVVNMNEPLGDLVLPEGLCTLEFGFRFDQLLDGITLPSSLHTLIFGFCFKQSLVGINLPSNLVIHKRGPPILRQVLWSEMSKVLNFLLFKFHFLTSASHATKTFVISGLVHQIS